MKRSLIIMLMMFMASFSNADILKGTTLRNGQYAVSYESGSQTIATNDNAKFQVNSLNAPALYYGITDKWTIGYEGTVLGIINYPGLKDSKVTWGVEKKGLPGALTVEYYFGKFADIDVKFKLKQLMCRRKVTIDKDEPSLLALQALPTFPREDVEIFIQDTNLMFTASKKITDKFSVAGSFDLMYLDYSTNELGSEMFNDTDKKFIRLALGLDYEFISDAFVYLYLAHAFDSSAVGTYDDDTKQVIHPATKKVLYDPPAIKRDNYGVCQIGLKYFF